MEKQFGSYEAISLLLLVTTLGLTSGCATKNYVRTQVNTSANEINARMDAKDRNLQSGIDATSSQTSELSGVAREHTQKIASLDSGLKETDGKATQAMNLGQEAQRAATEASGHVSRLDMEFQNRNQYSLVNEYSIPFAFGSASVNKNSVATLQEIAQQVKDAPNAILVLEGRTDSTGDELYNIQLGEKRLDAVVRYLVVEQAVPLHQVYKMSFGEVRPVASNDTPQGRAQNRAVVVRLMEPNGGSDTGNGALSMTDPMTE